MRLATGARLSSAIRALAKRRRSLSFNVGLRKEKNQRKTRSTREKERENTKKPLSKRPISATSIYQRRAALDRARGIRCVSDGSLGAEEKQQSSSLSCIARPRITITRVRMWPRGFVGIRATELRLKLVGHFSFFSFFLSHPTA